MCSIEGCDNEINRDDLCFKHKIKTVRMSAAQIKLERNDGGWGIDPSAGTRENVRRMYEDRRANGQTDPVPENSKAAAFAPARGVIR
jgi:hypothetical protein